MAVEASDAVGRGPGWLPTRSYGLKLLLVCALALALTIPALFVFVVSADRQGRYGEVLTEVGDLRGGDQVLAGPMLAAPYEREVINVDGTVLRTEEALYVVHAMTGQARASLESEELKRSIYKVPVYTATVDFAATFDLADARAEAAELGVDWSRAHIVLGAYDLRGAREAGTLRAGGATAELEPAAAPYNLAGGYQLMSAPIAGADSLQTLDVEAHLVFSGSQRFGFAPFARTTEATVEADWPHPSFQGGFLPVERDVREDGFTATWSVPFLARGAAGEGDSQMAGYGATMSRDLGVFLMQPIDIYVSVGRALKYALMFVGFVFLAFFLFEVASGERMHPAQYVLVGLSQATFYLLLLALSEHVGFNLAYAAAAALTVAAISLYAASVYGSTRYGLWALVVFTLIYVLLFGLLSLQDHALLMGALATFAALAAAMLLTRRVDWYGKSGAR